MDETSSIGAKATHQIFQAIANQLQQKPKQASSRQDISLEQHLSSTQAYQIQTDGKNTQVKALEVFEFSFKFEIETQIGNTTQSLSIEASGLYAQYQEASFTSDDVSNRAFRKALQQFKPFEEQNKELPHEQMLQKFQEMIERITQKAAQTAQNSLRDHDQDGQRVIEDVSEKLLKKMDHFLKGQTELS